MNTVPIPERIQAAADQLAQRKFRLRVFRPNQAHDLTAFFF